MKLLKSSLYLLLSVLVFACTKEEYPDLDKGIYAEISTDVGDVLVKLEYQDVPMTVANFVSLAEGTNLRVTDSMIGKPFYDGLNFHRVISVANGDAGDFMIQGGCPLGNGMGGPGYKFDDEFVKTESGNYKYSHKDVGVISMANSGPNGNGSQFFITIASAPHLDGKHTIFGKVENGFNIVKDSIVRNTVINSIDIIRVGSKAKSFDAYEVFEEIISEDQKEAMNQKAKIEGLKEEFLVKMEEYKAEAQEFPSGLKMYHLKKGDGVKPGIGADIRVSYSVFFTDGKILDTNRKELALEYGIFNPQKDARGLYSPFPAKYSMDGDLIQGFKEGLTKMRFGDRVVLFIPYHLGYGEQGGRGLPPKSDLIFELEIFPKEDKN